MAELEDAAAKLIAALESLESALVPLDEALKRHARDAAEIASLSQERQGLLARIADLEDETRSLSSVTEEVEDRLDGAIAEIRSALAR